MTIYTLFADNGLGQYVTNGRTVVLISNDFDIRYESLDGFAEGNFNREFFKDLTTNASEDNVARFAEMFGGRCGALGDFNHPIIDTLTI